MVGDGTTIVLWRTLYVVCSGGKQGMVLDHDTYTYEKDMRADLGPMPSVSVAFFGVGRYVGNS